MRRRIPGLHEAAPQTEEVPAGFFLVRVSRASYRSHPEKPFLTLHFTILEPRQFASRSISGRLYCTVKALWKLNWFLREFGYDIELLGRDEIDNKALVGLCGVIKVSHSRVNGRTYLNLDGFAPATTWDEFLLEQAG